jgi:hypothetical protein
MGGLFSKRAGVGKRLEPGQSWRQLEQQRKELPLCESQQQHPGEQEQQSGVPPFQYGLMAERAVFTDAAAVLSGCPDACPAPARKDPDE